jgi:Tol biopolymer transport system component
LKHSLLLTASLSAFLVLSPTRSNLETLAQERQFTLDQVMSAPFPSDLVASPAGGKVAWVLSAKGARNIWMAEPPGYKGRKLTSYTQDDGMEIGELVWSPDAQSIVFTRGGDQEGFGENPNPQNLPEEPKQQLMIVSLDGKSRVIGEGHSAVISPNGDRIAYINKRDVWSAKVDGSEKPALLFQTKGRSGALHWSVDGSKIAFVSNRGDHNFIGVYDVGAKSIRYLDPSVDRDSEPVWSRDGKQVAFFRIPTSREAGAFAPRRSGRPWSIRVANVETGVGREEWHADDGRGSVFRGVVADDQLLWSNDDRLVFPWEKDGWTHLYSISASATSPKPTLLTPGEFEVEHVSLSPDGKEIVYSSNQGDIDHRHIWRVTTAGGRPASAVTSGNGIEWKPVETSDGKAIAFLRSEARSPERAAIIVSGRKPQDLAPNAIPSEFPESSLVEPQQVIFSSADGMKIHGQLFLPRNLDASRRHPAVIFFHGGSTCTTTATRMR